MRHEFTQRTKHILASRVGWRCSNPECRAATTGPNSDRTRTSNIGHASHITAAALGGPRFDSKLYKFQRRDIANAIWLCANCAKKVDDDPQRYGAATLWFWRQDAEDLADSEKGRPIDLIQSVRFASIQLSPSCMWRSAHRLLKVRTAHGGSPDLGFHQVPAHAWEALKLSTESHSLDPILDIAISNDTDRTTVISALGLVPLHVWTVLKGLPGAYKIPVVDKYAIDVTRLVPGVPQMLNLPDPIAVPSHGTGRYVLCLRGFRQAADGNETLIRLAVYANNANWFSRAIYFGLY